MTAIKKSGNIDDNNQEEKKNEQLEIVDAIKSINPTLLDGIPQKKRAEVLKTITSVIHVTRSKSGPLPDPSDLKEYAE